MEPFYYFFLSINLATNSPAVIPVPRKASRKERVSRGSPHVGKAQSDSGTWHLAQNFPPKPDGEIMARVSMFLPFPPLSSFPFLSPSLAISVSLPLLNLLLICFSSSLFRFSFDFLFFLFFFSYFVFLSLSHSLFRHFLFLLYISINPAFPLHEHRILHHVQPSKIPIPLCIHLR